MCGGFLFAWHVLDRCVHYFWYLIEMGSRQYGDSADTAGVWAFVAELMLCGGK